MPCQFLHRYCSLRKEWQVLNCTDQTLYNALTAIQSKVIYVQEGGNGKQKQQHEELLPKKNPNIKDSTGKDRNLWTNSWEMHTHGGILLLGRHWPCRKSVLLILND